MDIYFLFSLKLKPEPANFQQSLLFPTSCHSSYANDIGNYVNIRLLKAVHDWLAQVLRRIPEDEDGTFHQTRSLDRLVGVGESESCSFDLKSATDRWPLVLLFELMQALFERSFVVNSRLATNVFEVRSAAI